MRKVLIVPLVPLLAYFAWPAAAAWQLRVAVKARDIAGIEGKVDWQTLRANLKQTVGGNIKEASQNPEHGVFTRALLQTLGPIAADTVIDLTVTPNTLAKVLAGRSLLDDIGLAPQRGTAPTAQADDDADPLAPRRLRWAFFETPTRFRIVTIDPKMPGKRVVSVLALQGSSWKLVDVYYVTT